MVFSLYYNINNREQRYYKRQYIDTDIDHCLFLILQITTKSRAPIIMPRKYMSISLGI